MTTRHRWLSLLWLACWLAACAAPASPNRVSGPTPPPTTPAPATALTPRASAITRLSWSPDGVWLASSSGGFDSADNTIHIRHADGSLAYVLTGHTQPVTDVAWSPDGQTLASASLDETVRLWRRDGAPLAAWRGQAGRVFAVAWAPQGNQLASGSIVTFTNPTVQIWNLAGQVVITLTTAFSGGKFYNLAWSPDGQYLLGGATDYKLWRADGTEVFWLQGCFACTPAWGMAWSPTSRAWAVGDENSDIQIYTGAGQKVAAVHDESSINSLAWSPDGTRLAGSRTLWRADGTRLKTLSLGPLDYTNSVAWSPDGHRLASGGSDKLVHLWTIDGDALGQFAGHTAAINVVAWSPAGGRLASGSEDGTVRVWEVP